MQLTKLAFALPQISGIALKPYQISFEVCKAGTNKSSIHQQGIVEPNSPQDFLGMQALRDDDRIFNIAFRLLHSP